jgi:tetratricopeptide (TPR) repeat protein
MKKGRRNISYDAMDGQWNDLWNSGKDENLLTLEDRQLFEKISYYMKGRFDIEDVKKDPRFIETNRITKDMVDSQEKGRDLEIENYINSGINSENDREKIEMEICDIENEIKEYNLDTLAKEWIKNWDDQVIDSSKFSAKDEIRNFVSDSLRKEIKVETGYGRKNRSVISMYLKYSIAAAAVIAGLFLFIRVLLPSSDPDRVFRTYYEPFNIIQPVTRSIESDIQGSLNSAIESYRSGRYEEAYLGFSDILKKDTSFVPARFFLGLTDLASGKYNEAVRDFEEVNSRKSEFVKEARWYLGLALLKTGDLKGARECFLTLSQSPGYFKDRSEKILRRLK